MESPIPILPLPTPDAETEKLIRMKDEEVGGRREGGHDCRVKGSEGEAGGGARPRVFSHSDLGRPTHQLRRMQEMLQKMKQQMQDQ